MSILFPNQNQDYTLLSEKTNFKNGKTGEDIPEKRTVITRSSDTVITSVGNFDTDSPASEAKVYGTRRILAYVFTTGNTLKLRAKSISANIKKTGSIADLKIDLYKLDDNNEPIGSIITTATISTTSITTSYTWENTSITGTYLEPNTNYGLVFRQTTDAGDVDNYISISARAGSNKFYLSTNSGTSWTRDNDFYIKCNINYYSYEKDTFYLGNTGSYNTTISVFSYENPTSAAQHDYTQNFIGFSTSSAPVDSNLNVQTDGIITGLVDNNGDPLVNGTTYYFDTASNGKIKTTANGKQIGKAIDTDKLLIIRDI